MPEGYLAELCQLMTCANKARGGRHVKPIRANVGEISPHPYRFRKISSFGLLANGEAMVSLVSRELPRAADKNHQAF